MFLEELTHFRDRLLHLALLRGGNTRIRHHPVGHEIPEEKTLGKTECLRPGKEQLFRFLDLFLPLNLRFVHKITLYFVFAWRHTRRSRSIQMAGVNPRH